jgi:predicted amidophosphoribosyltransferase
VTLGAPLHDLLAALSRAAAPILDLIAPERCGACGDEGALFCTSCRAALLAPGAVSLHPPPQGVRAAATVGSYADGLDAALRTLKFHGVPRLARPLGAALAAPIAAVTAELEGAAPILVPTPTDPARRRERGFDHALLLAAAAGEATGLRVVELLERTRAVEPLHGLGRAERRRALDQAIAIRPGASALTPLDREALVILVDDIWTSGATFEAAARALTAAGWQRIAAVAVAREPLRERRDTPAGAV